MSRFAKFANRKSVVGKKSRLDKGFQYVKKIYELIGKIIQHKELRKGFLFNSLSYFQLEIIGK